MAHLSAQGVQDFVRRQNGMAHVDGAGDAQPLNRKPSTKGLHDDLKVATPTRRKSQTNTHAPRNGEQTGRVATLRSRSGNRPPSRGLLSTDASNADRTSASGNTQDAKQGKSQKRPVPVQSHKGDRDESRSTSEETDTDGEGNALPTLTQNHPQAHGAHIANGLTSRRISGDSYPATTSGRPSDVDENEAHAQARNVQPPTGPLTVRGSGARTDMTAPNVAPPQAGAQAQVNQPVHANNDLAVNFVFAKAPSAHINVSRTLPGAVQSQSLAPLAAHPAHPPQPDHDYQAQLAGQQLPSAHALAKRALLHAQPAARPSAVETPSHMHAPIKSVLPPEPRQPLEEVSNRYAEPGVRRFAAFLDPEQRARKSNTSTSGLQPQHSDLPQPSDNQYSDFGYGNGIDGQDYDGLDEQQQYLQDQHLDDHQHGDQRLDQQRLEDHQPEERRSQDDMDYVGSELYSKRYADVKAQSFDLDPHAEPFHIPQELPSDTLQDKLVSAMKLQGQPHEPNPQSKFFQSMTSAEWEDAGDWFLDRFGDLIGKLKNARKEKRKFARQFESEVEERHNAVAKKQKLTESALGEMKESGGKVLEGTPKKKSIRPKK